MSFADFLLSIARDSSPPGNLGPALAALWYARKGEWNRAHELVQNTSGKDGAWVHAHLHRKEGDPSNAAYWYRLSGHPPSRSGVDEEWTQITRTLLNDAGV